MAEPLLWAASVLTSRTFLRPLGGLQAAPPRAAWTSAGAQRSQQQPTCWSRSQRASGSPSGTPWQGAASPRQPLVSAVPLVSRPRGHQVRPGRQWDWTGASSSLSHRGHTISRPILAQIVHTTRPSLRPPMSWSQAPPAHHRAPTTLVPWLQQRSLSCISVTLISSWPNRLITPRAELVPAHSEAPGLPLSPPWPFVPLLAPRAVIWALPAFLCLDLQPAHPPAGPGPSPTSCSSFLDSSHRDDRFAAPQI